MFDYLALLGLWLCQPEVFPAIKNVITHWYNLRYIRKETKRNESI